MAIHHTQVKKAEKIGVILTDLGSEKFDAFWPKHNLHIFGVSASDAIEQAKAAQEVHSECVAKGYTPKWVHHPQMLRLTNIQADGDKWASTEYRTPADLLGILKSNDWTFTFDFEEPNLGDAMVDEDEDGESDAAEVDNVQRSEAGIALDGAIAYAEGTVSADCPYSSEDESQYDDFIRWNDEWDAAADAKTEEDGVGGSVVKQKYRAIYAERGHPTHCGDWLAELLNNLVLGKKATDIQRFEDICYANGVSLAKYKHEGKGWEGRLRMTGRNLLAKVVFYNDGVLNVPRIDTDDPGMDQYTAPADWMQAQRFKRTKAADAPSNDA